MIDLVFEGDRVKSNWYDPELEEIICLLCGKACTDKWLCVNANRYCG